MTGRELIMYILENHLEDEQVFDDERVGSEFLGFLNAFAAAAKFGVGLATIQTWYELGLLNGFKIGDKVFIAANTKSPIELNCNGIDGGSHVQKH